MLTETITPDVLARSVIAVPPLARNADFSINQAANRKMIGYLEEGGVSNILYGGNANFYHISSTQFREALQLLTESASHITWMIPSVGPSFGLMMDIFLIYARAKIMATASALYLLHVAPMGKACDDVDPSASITTL